MIYYLRAFTCWPIRLYTVHTGTLLVVLMGRYELAEFVLILSCDGDTRVTGSNCPCVSCNILFFHAKFKQIKMAHLPYGLVVANVFVMRQTNLDTGFYCSSLYECKLNSLLCKDAFSGSVLEHRFNHWV